MKGNNLKSGKPSSGFSGNNRNWGTSSGGGSARRGNRSYNYSRNTKSSRSFCSAVCYIRLVAVVLLYFISVCPAVLVLFHASTANVMVIFGRTFNIFKMLSSSLLSICAILTTLTCVFISRSRFSQKSSSYAQSTSVGSSDSRSMSSSVRRGNRNSVDGPSMDEYTHVGGDTPIIASDTDLYNVSSGNSDRRRSSGGSDSRWSGSRSNRRFGSR